jgi:branched-chain amino acid transport system substrate-binding protein
MKRILIVSTIVFLVLSGCQKKGADVITVGISGPMTGPQAKLGSDFKNGVSIAVQEWNEKGGLLGKKIEVIVGDDQADPKQAVSVANKTVNEGAVGVIGHFNSSCSIPASDVYNRAGIPMITPASTNPILTERGYRGVFRVCGRDDQQGGVAAKFVSEKLKLKRVAILHDKTTYGQGLVEEFKKALAPGVEVVYYSGIVQGDKDFKTVLTAVKQKRPELVYFGGIYPEGGLLVKQAKEIGLDVPFMSGDGVFDPLFIEIAGPKTAEGTYFTFSPDPENIPSAKLFVTKYREKYGDLGAYSIYAYDAAQILFSAVREAGTTDGKTISDRIHAMTFNGALGSIKFDEKGDVTAPPYVVWIAKNGKFVEYWKP